MFLPERLRGPRVRSLYVLGIAYLALSAFALARGPVSRSDPASGPSHPAPEADGASWFRHVRPFCNALEVETVQRQRPAPTTVDGAGFAAACWALAGRIRDARARILAVAAADRWRAAGIVFEVGHPVADLGDDRSAGPIMELVVEFWPNHYMALYHAGAARFATGDHAAAQRHLLEFLRHYHQDDAWTRRARSMLRELTA